MLKVTAKTLFEIQIGNLKLKNNCFIIPDLHHTCILGHEFLTNYKKKHMKKIRLNG